MDGAKGRDKKGCWGMDGVVHEAEATHGNREVGNTPCWCGRGKISAVGGASQVG